MDIDRAAKEVRDIIQEKVVGVWVAEHTEDKHHYRNTKTGKLVDSVTTKLILQKEHLIPWAVEIGIQYYAKRVEYCSEEDLPILIKNAKFAYTGVRDDAGNVGTAAHHIAEAYVKEWTRTGVRPADIRTLAPEGTDSRSIAGARSVESLFNQFPVIPVAAEILVGDDDVNCAGALDQMIMNQAGELELWDWKTSNRVDKVGYPLQVSAYKYMFEKMTGLSIRRSRVVHLSKEYDKATLWDLENEAATWEAFKALSSVYDWRQSKDEKIVKYEKIATFS